MSDETSARQRLIEAAVEVISTRGESALRLAQIAEMVGIKQPSIYYFFPSREDLVLAAHRERYRRSVLDVIESYDSNVGAATTRDEFVRAATESFRFVLSDKRTEARATRIALLAKAETNAELRAEVNDVAFAANRQLAGVLEEAQSKGWIRDDVSAMSLVMLIRALVIGRYLLEIDDDHYDRDEWTDLAIQAIQLSFLEGTSAPRPTIGRRHSTGS